MQKLDFAKVRNWRAKRSAKRGAAKRGDIIDVLKSDALKLDDTNFRCRTFLPSGVTTTDALIPCCTIAFCKLYGISSKTKSAYWNKVIAGAEIEQLEQSELKLGRGEGRRQQTLMWMKETFHLLCDILPTSDYSAKNYHLPKCMSKTTIHKEYYTEFQAKMELYGDDYKPYSRSTFAKLWLDEYSYVQIPEHNAFSVCVHCSALHDRLISATKSRNKALLKEIQLLRRHHLRFISDERLTYRDHQRLARDFPDLYVCLTVDGMDQAKLRSPHFAGGAIPKGATPCCIIV